MSSAMIQFVVSFSSASTGSSVGLVRLLVEITVPRVVNEQFVVRSQLLHVVQLAHDMVPRGLYIRSILTWKP